MESFKIQATFPAPVGIVYAAWLDSKKHSMMTGYAAEIDPRVGGKFNVWDDYITGTTTQLIPDKKIVQKWRTIDFPDELPDSKLEIIFDQLPNGTRLTLKHSNIPDGQGNEYKEGWKEYYFKPMKSYFSNFPGSQGQ